MEWLSTNQKAKVRMGLAFTHIFFFRKNYTPYNREAYTIIFKEEITMKKFVIGMILMLACMALYASFTTPASYDVTGYKYNRHTVSRDVTYQARNIYGMKLGEEYTIRELSPYARDYN